MSPTHRDRMKKAGEGLKWGLSMEMHETLLVPRKGTFIFDMRDAETGEPQVYWEKENLIVLDAGILSARLYRNSQDPTPGVNNGLRMLAVGTGATGNILSPDAPQPTQRKLNTEIARKTFSSAQFRDAGGAAVSIPTNIVDFTTTFGASEAVGPLNEMGLMSPYSSNPLVTNPIPNGTGTPFPYDPTFDVTHYDLMANYLPFSVVSKPSGSVLTVTWRLSY